MPQRIERHLVGIEPPIAFTTRHDVRAVVIARKTCSTAGHQARRSNGASGGRPLAAAFRPAASASADRHVDALGLAGNAVLAATLGALRGIARRGRAPPCRSSTRSRAACDGLVPVLCQR